MVNGSPWTVLSSDRFHDTVIFKNAVVSMARVILKLRTTCKTWSHTDFEHSPVQKNFGILSSLAESIVCPQKGQKLKGCVSGISE